MGNKHYITADDQGRILDGWSNGTHPERDVTGAILLQENAGYQFRLWPGGEENPDLIDWDCIPIYHWDGSNVTARTQEEIEADRAALPEPPAPEKNVWDQMAEALTEGVNSIDE